MPYDLKVYFIKGAFKQFFLIRRQLRQRFIQVCVEVPIQALVYVLVERNDGQQAKNGQVVRELNCSIDDQADLTISRIIKANFSIGCGYK